MDLGFPPYFYEKCCENFDGYSIEYVNWFWKVDHFHIFDSTEPWTQNVFLFCRVFLNLFLQRFEVFILHVFHIQVCFTPRYLIVFVVILNDIVPWSFTQCICYCCIEWLLVLAGQSVSCYFAEVALFFFFFKVFWWSFGDLINKAISFKKRDNLIFFFLSWMHFYNVLFLL